MKVLFLTDSDAPALVTPLHIALRQYVGTCDIYYLTPEQFEDIREFFASFIRLSQYDRVVVLVKPSIILQNWRFYCQLPNLTVVRLQPDEESENEKLSALFEKISWLRYLSPDENTVSAFSGKGMDAHWLRPVFDPEVLLDGARRTPPVVHLLEKTDNLLFALRENLPNNANICKMSKDDLRFYIAKSVHKGDIVVFSNTYTLSDDTPLIKAMAAGALVIYPDMAEAKRKLYGWEKETELRFVNNAHCVEMVKVLYEKTEIADAYLAKNKEKVALFYPKSVGQQLGERLVLPMRVKKEYPKLLKLFWRLTE